VLLVLGYAPAAIALDAVRAYSPAAFPVAGVPVTTNQMISAALGAWAGWRWWRLRGPALDEPRPLGYPLWPSDE
jgi:hypothetical protein